MKKKTIVYENSEELLEQVLDESESDELIDKLKIDKK